VSIGSGSPAVRDIFWLPSAPPRATDKRILLPSGLFTKASCPKRSDQFACKNQPLGLKSTSEQQFWYSEVEKGSLEGGRICLRIER